MDDWKILFHTQIIVLIALGIGLLVVRFFGKGRISTQVISASVFSCLLSAIFWRLITVGPNTGTAICYIGDFFFGEIAALAMGFSLYAVRRMQKRQYFLPVLSAVLAVANLIAETVLITAGQ